MRSRSVYEARSVSRSPRRSSLASREGGGEVDMRIGEEKVRRSSCIERAASNARGDCASASSAAASRWEIDEKAASRAPLRGVLVA